MSGQWTECETIQNTKLKIQNEERQSSHLLLLRNESPRAHTVGASGIIVERGRTGERVYVLSAVLDTFAAKSIRTPPGIRIVGGPGFSYQVREGRKPLCRHPWANFPLRSRKNADPRIQVKIFVPYFERKDGFVLDSRIKYENDELQTRQVKLFLHLLREPTKCKYFYQKP